MVKLLVFGPKGKMGKAIIKKAYEHENIQIIGGVAPQGRDYVGRDLGITADLGKLIESYVVEDAENLLRDCDMVVECTNKITSMEILRKCLAFKKPLVSGTTGFSELEREEFKNAALTIPVLLAGNTSRQAHLLFQLSKYLSKWVGNKADIDIIEAHDNEKLDAPSGTSREIAKNILREQGLDFENYVQSGLKGYGKREKNKIVIHSHRTGNFSGEHRIVFGLENERLELSYSVYNMEPFAEGIVDAIIFLSQKEKGFYGIEDVFSEIY